jgi:hypothetical protein
MSVIAISVGEKLPETTCAHPSRNSQMRTMIVSQGRNDGNASHLLNLSRRKPRTIPAHSGAVCTMCRNTPWLTEPTTSKAAMIATQHHAMQRVWTGVLNSMLTPAPILVGFWPAGGPDLPIVCR